MRRLWKAFLTDEAGQDLAEYALLLALIAIAVVVALPPVGQAIKTVFQNIGDRLNKPDVTSTGN
jgi:Flp pilus assembly pilin Flp